MSIDLSTRRRNADDDAWQAHIDSKRAESQRHKAIELAAAIAATKPQPVAKVAKIKRPPAPRKTSGPRVYTKKPALEKIRPCVTCGHPTRANKYRAADFPGTRPRRSGGNCTSCVDRSDRATVPTEHRVDVAAIVAAYHPGLSLYRLAEITGHSRDTLRHVLATAGVRPAGGER